MKRLAATETLGTRAQGSKGTRSRSGPARASRPGAAGQKEVVPRQKRLRARIQAQRDQIRALREQQALDRQELESEQQRIIAAQQELEAWHDRYIDLYDFAPVGYLTLNRSGCIVNINRTAVQLFGYERRHLVGMPLMVLVAKADRAAFSQHLLKARNATEKQATAELWFSRKGGQSVLLQLASLRSRETTPGVFRIHTAITDITEQHAAAEAQRRLAVLVASSDDAIIGTSLKGIVTSWNQGAEQLFGYTAKEVVGKSIKVLIPQARQKEETELLRKIRRGRPVKHYETIRRHKNGSQIPIFLTVSPLRDAGGQITGAAQVAHDITRRKQEEETRARLAVIIDSSQDAIYSEDLEGVVTSWNPGAERLFGYSATEAIGEPVTFIFPPDRLDEEVRTLERVRRGDRLETYDTARRHKDGTIIEVSLSVSPIRDSDGNVVGVSKIARDITARKRTEAALRESEERLRLAQQAAHVGTFEWNIETGVNRWTPELEALYGLPRGSFPGTYAAWEALVHAEDRPETVRRIKEAMETGGFAAEWRVIWPDGRVRWLAGRGRVFKDRFGRPVRLLGVNLDITERKQAEDSLRQSEARFHALIDASAQIVWTSNARGEVVEDSPSWRAFTGQTVHQWLDGAWPNAFHPDDRQRMLDLWRKAVADKTLASTEYRLRHVSGQWRWMARRAVPLFDINGAVRGWVGMDVDITERKQAEEWLRKAKEELEQRVQDRTMQLREALDRAQDLYHKAPCGYHSLDRNGLYLQVNDTELQWLGYHREELVRKKTVFDLLTPQSRIVKEAALRQLVERGTIADVELDFIRADGSLLPVLLSATAIRDEAGRFFMSRSMIIDLTARKRADRALRESEGRLQAILENSPAIMFVKDIRGRYLHINREFTRAFRVTWGQIVGKTDAEIFKPAEAAAFAANDRLVIEAGAPVQFDEVAQQEDGRHTSIVSKFPLFDSEGRVYAVGGIVTDVTERRRLEAEVLRVSDREQLRISQDLHDGVGQQLAGIWCLSDVLRKLLEAQALPEAAQAAKISGLLKVALNQTRSLARGLHPVSTEPNGLMSALRELAASVAEMFKVTCEFECPQPVLVHEATVAANLYRIAQEAVTNAVKHGQAQKVAISLSLVSQIITLAIRDDGVGIQKTPRQRKGMGLRIMNYRASTIGGTLTIQKKRDGGTDVVCAVPETAALERTPNGQANAKNERAKEDFSGR